MVRRGFTLVEILISLVILGFVTGMAMTMFQFQNRNWKTSSDKAETVMMARGTLDEIARSIRMTGGWLPDKSAGIKVWGSGPERITFVLNNTQWIDTLRDLDYLPATRQLRIQIDSATNFSQGGQVMLTVLVPPTGATSGTTGNTPRTFQLPIQERIASTGGCGDSLLLDASSLYDAPNSWTWASAIDRVVNSPVYNFDSVTYRQVQDTLMVRWNTLPETPFALGIETFSLKYWHPVAGWLDSLSGTAPANRIEKVRIRVVSRSRKPDSKLLAQQPSSGGYHRSVLETEISLRNDSLVNR
jgi:prepilin-type N-terminal cleavage/methylation domain-containing protein